MIVHADNSELESMDGESLAPSQEMESYSDGKVKLILDYFSFLKSMHVFFSDSAQYAFLAPPCRVQSAPVNACTPRGKKRMLRYPENQEEFDRNVEIMKGFFDEYLMKLSVEDIAYLGKELLGCEYGKLLFEISITVGTICVHKLVSGLFDRWIRKTGWKADLHQVKCILKEMGNISMCHSLDCYIRELS